MLYSVLSTLFLALLCVAAPTAYPQGVIEAPLNGTVIRPGQAFNFTYNAHADYCISSYNFSIWVMTSTPGMFAPSENFMTGYYFGLFDVPNYPAVPYAKNPPPPQLVMPDLSQNQGGWGAGQSANNATFYITVMEEWGSCDGALGKRISLAMNSIMYNATISS
ncbi:hypothetical protein EWM64_g3080 [Hericium alpestre]|uniref:Uncharacterized protein n=1 Tax=Hericium alpestre TaxID=135208 RepID=A0A4Z0A3B3_9AGAM|nr:hypothetical protein EWM64_g3080 [Hericium alpestre]